MKTDALIFIHPKDFRRLLEKENGPIDIISSSWPDGLKVLWIYGECTSVPFRVTDKVPEFFGQESLRGYYPDVDSTPPSARLSRLIYGCIASEYDWKEKDEEFTKQWRSAHPNWTPDSQDENPCECVLCS